MSQWLLYRHMAVDPSAFCAFGIQRRKEATAFFYDLWGIARGGSQSVLGTYDSMMEAREEFAKMVEAAMGEGD